MRTSFTIDFVPLLLTATVFTAGCKVVHWLGKRHRMKQDDLKVGPATCRLYLRYDILIRSSSVNRQPGAATPLSGRSLHLVAASKGSAWTCLGWTASL